MEKKKGKKAWILGKGSLAVEKAAVLS